MLMMCSFGVTELAKATGDEEHAHGRDSAEKGPSTQVYETTTDASLAQRRVAGDKEVQI